MKVQALSNIILLMGFALSAQTIPSYNLNIDFNKTKLLLTGKCSVDIPVSLVNNDTIFFDVRTPMNGTMDIKSVLSVSGQTLQHKVEKGVLKISNPASTKIEINYLSIIHPKLESQFGYYAFAEFGNGRLAYPILFDDLNKHFPYSNFHVSLSYPTSFTAITSTMAETKKRQKNIINDTYKVDSLSAFAIVLGEDFKLITKSVGDTELSFFFHPNNSEVFEQIDFQATEALNSYLELFGFFPSKQLGIIQGHPRWSGGYPLPNIFTIHMGRTYNEFLQWITAHEFGHFYFGHYVRGKDEQVDWLQLALGIWLDQYHLSVKKNISLEEQWQQAFVQGASIVDYLEAVEGNYNQTIGLLSSEYQNFDFDYNSLIRHGKAAVGVYLQSQLIGKESFIELQRSLISRYSNQILPKEDFYKVLEEYGCHEATAFFDAWERDGAEIDAVLHSVLYNNKTNFWDITIRRTGSVPYPIEVRVTTKEKVLDYVLPGKEKQIIINQTLEPLKVELDPRGIIPMRNTSNANMKALISLAKERAGLYEQFFLFGKQVLDETSFNSYLKYRLVRRYFLQGKWKSAIDIWTEGQLIRTREECIAAIYVARCKNNIGIKSSAMDELLKLEELAKSYDLEFFWQNAVDELK